MPTSAGVVSLARRLEGVCIRRRAPRAPVDVFRRKRERAVGRGAGRVIAGAVAIVASAVIPGSQGWLTAYGTWLVSGAVQDPPGLPISINRMTRVDRQSGNPHRTTDQRMILSPTL